MLAGDALNACKLSEKHHLSNLVDLKGIEPKMPYGTGLQPAHDPYVSKDPDYTTSFASLSSLLVNLLHNLSYEQIVFF